MYVVNRIWREIVYGIVLVRTREIDDGQIVEKAERFRRDSTSEMILDCRRQGDGVAVRVDDREVGRSVVVRERVESVVVVGRMRGRFVDFRFEIANQFEPLITMTLVFLPTVKNDSVVRRQVFAFLFFRDRLDNNRKTRLHDTNHGQSMLIRVHAHFSLP